MRNLSKFQKFADTAGAETMRELLIKCCCFTHNFLYHKNTQNVPYISGLNPLKTSLTHDQLFFCSFIFSLSLTTTTEYFLQLPLFVCLFHRCILNLTREAIFRASFSLACTNRQMEDG